MGIGVRTFIDSQDRDFLRYLGPRTTEGFLRESGYFTVVIQNKTDYAVSTFDALNWLTDQGVKRADMVLIHNMVAFTNQDTAAMFKLAWGR